MLPLAGTILAGLAQGLGGWFADELGRATLAVDLDRVPALSEDRERLWASVTAADFLSVDEKRELLEVGR